MADYSISSGSGRVQISTDTATYLAVQVSAASLDADITVKLQHTSDGVSYIDIPDTETTLTAATDSILIETFKFNLDICYLYINVGSATTGDIDVFVSPKKKESSNDVNIANTPLAVSGTFTADVYSSTNFDAFGRLRVSQVNSQIDLKQIHDELPLFYDIAEVGTGVHTYVSSGSESLLQTSANNDVCIMQTKQRFNYSSGKSALFLITFRNFHTETNITKRVGYYNSSTTSPFSSSRDGLYLQNNSGTIRFVVAKNGTLTNYDQSSWTDKLDGTGASGVNLQLGTETGNYIFWLDFEWLGVGQVRFGFIKDGEYLLAHTIDHIGSDGVYMVSPNHSIRAEIVQTGAGSGSLTLICATFGTEGNINNLGYILSDNLGSTPLSFSTGGTRYALIGIGLQSTKVDTLVDLIRFSIIATSNDNHLWELWLNPTVAGTFTYSNVTNSSVQIAKGTGSTNTVTTTGATLLYSGYLNSQTANEFDFVNALRLGMTIAGTTDKIVLCTTPLTNASNVLASITWKELS